MLEKAELTLINMLSKTKKVITTPPPVLCSVASYKLFYSTMWSVGTLSLLFVPPTEGGGMEINMNIYRFIDSKDIAKYLKEIHYEFSMPEMAFLVYICHTATLDDKFKAWQEMIDTLQDCRHETSCNTIESFHGFLREHMDLQKKYIEQFYQHEGFVYSCEWQYEPHRLYEGEREAGKKAILYFLPLINVWII